MKITRSKSGEGAGRIVRSFLGGDIISFGGKKYKLASTDVNVHCINKEEYKSTAVMFFVTILAITVIGLILAIPLYIVAGKRQRVTVNIDTPDESGVIAVVDETEWKILSKYVMLSK